MYINVTATAVQYEVHIAIVYSKKGASQACLRKDLR